MDLVAENDVVTDRDRQWVRTLEDHADLFAHLDQLHTRIVDVFVQHLDGALDAHITQALVDTVDAAQESGLSTARGSDERRDDALLNAQVNVVQSLKSAIPEVQLVGMDGVLGSAGSFCDVCVHGLTSEQ